MRLGKTLLFALALGGCSGIESVLEDNGSTSGDGGMRPGESLVELSADIQSLKSSIDAVSYDASDASTWDGDTCVRNVVFAVYECSDGHLCASEFNSNGSSLKVNLKKGESYTVYAIANMGDIRSSLPVMAGGMESWRVRLEKYSDLDALPMSGSVSLDISGDTAVQVPLQMLCHRLVLSLTEVRGFSLKGVRMRQAALDMTPFSFGSKPAVVGEGDEATESDIAALNSGGTADFYLLENMRGELLPSNTDSWNKVPSSLSDLDANMATYVEITMDYDGGYGVSGEVVYRFCLGDDVLSNFDVQRARTKFLEFTPSEGNLYRGSWKIDSDKVEDHRVLLFCEGSQNICLTQGSSDEVMAKIYYNVSNSEGYSVSNRPSDVGMCGSWMGSRWSFYPSTSSVQSQLQALSISMRRIDECRWVLSAENCNVAGSVPVEISTPDGRVRDKAVLSVVGRINWDNMTDFSNDNPYGEDAYRNWFTEGMKKTMKLSGFSSTSKVTAKIVSISQNGQDWTNISQASSCDYLDICSLTHDTSSASIVLGAKKAGYVKIQVDSPSTMQGQTFVVPVSDVDLRCDRNYTQESYAPRLTGEARNLAIHCYLPGFDDTYGDGAFDNPGMNRSMPDLPYGYYEGIIPFSAFDSNSSQSGYWDRYVRPVASLNYRPGTQTRYLEFKCPGDSGYSATKDSYGYSCCRYRFCDIPLEEELSQRVPYASIRISKRSSPDDVEAVRNVFALPFFIPSQTPSYVGTIHDWSVFRESKLNSSYQAGNNYHFRTTDYVNVCPEAFIYSGASIVAKPHSANSDENESIALQYDGSCAVDASLSDSGHHALGRLDLYAQLTNEVSGVTRSVYAGYLEVFLHLALGARVVCSETSSSLPYTSDYSFPQGMSCHAYGIAMEWMEDIEGKCSMAEGIALSVENSARYLVNGGQNDDTALINTSDLNGGYFYYRDPRLASCQSSTSLSAMRTLRYYKSTHDGQGPVTLWNTLWMGISEDSLNSVDDVSYVLWSAPYNGRADNSGEWYSARWTSASELVTYGPEANVKLYKYDESAHRAVEQTSGILYYVPSNDTDFRCVTSGLSYSGKGYLVIHDLYQTCPSTRGWIANYEK